MDNKVSVLLRKEVDCDPSKGEFSKSIFKLDGCLDFDVPGGRGDVECIDECVEEWCSDTDYKHFPKGDGDVVLNLRETGEWQDVFWFKYYKVESFESLEYQQPTTDNRG